MKRVLWLVALLTLAGFVPAQQVSQEEIDKAIKNGADFLIKKHAGGIPVSSWEHEMIVYTLVHADVDPAGYAPLKDGIEATLALEPSKTGPKAVYRVALQALALHTVLLKIKRNSAYAKLYGNRVDAIQERIAFCGQALVDSQCGNGQWTYAIERKHTPGKQAIIETGKVFGKPTKNPDRNKPPAELKNSAGGKIAWENAVDLTGTVYKLVSKSGEANPGDKTGADRPREGGGSSGDNSSTQYGILGLIAAQMSGCIVPDETWRTTLAWFEKTQGADGGFAYDSKGSIEKKFVEPYGTMATVGIAGLAACYRYLGKKDPAKMPMVRSAIKWLATNFSVEAVPGTTKEGYTQWLYYYLYGLERVGAFLETETIGKHRWYDKGAVYLVGRQQADGSWPLINSNIEARKDLTMDMTTVGTCFAVLFLKRATKDIIETGTGGGNPPLIEQK